VQQPAHSQHSEVTSEVGSVAGNDELKVQDLTMMYGAKRDRDTVCCLLSLACFLQLYVSGLICGVSLNL